MDLLEVRAFVAVAEEGHFGRAAVRLQQAQPSLSRTIQHLERRLGVRLFDRTTRSVRLTVHGQALLAPARAIEESVRLAELTVEQSRLGEAGHVRLGFAGPSSHLLLSSLAQHVRLRQPGIELSLSTAFGADAVAQLHSNALDLAIVGWDRTPPGLNSRIVRVNTYVAAVASNHRVAEQPSVSIGDLMGDPWVLLDLSSGSALNDLIALKADETGKPLNVVQRAPDSWTIMALVAAGVGVTITMDSAFDRATPTGIAVVPLADEWEAGFARLMWRTEDRHPALLKVLELSEEALPSPAV